MQGKVNYRMIIIIAIIFFIFYGVFVFVTLRNKPISAFSALTNDTGSMLQDTRVHNWDEIKKDGAKREARDMKQETGSTRHE